MEELKIAYVVLSCVMIFFNAVRGGTNHMICKTVDGVFNDDVYMPQTPANIQNQGPPGKRGPSGMKGDIGAPGVKGQNGKAGRVDYSVVRRMVEADKEAVVGRIEKLEEMFLEIQKNISAVPVMTCDGTAYMGTCYWSIVYPTRRINLKQANDICAQKQGKLAYIRDSIHFEQIKTYVRTLIPSSVPWVHVWLGTTMDIDTKEMTLPDGSRAPFTAWLSDAPYTTHTTNIELQVYKEISHPHQAMFNSNPNRNEHGVLCQK